MWRFPCFKKCLFAAAGLLGILSGLRAQSVDDLVLMSEEFPPYNFVENDRKQGSSIDLMAAILQRLHSKLTRDDIQILPWARSFRALQEDPNTVLFAMTRTSQRETLFQWVGPISTARNVLMARKTLRVRVQAARDLGAYRVGVVRDDAGQQLLEKFGLPKEAEQLSSDGVSLVRKFISDRLDVVAYDENVLKWLLKKYGQDPNDYESVYLLEEGRHYFAFSKTVSGSLVRQFQETLDGMKRTGEYEEILEKYTK